MPDSEKPADNGGKKTFHKRRRFRKNRGERTEQQQNSQTAQNQPAGQGQPNQQGQQTQQKGQRQQSGQNQRGTQSQPSGQGQRNAQAQQRGQGQRSQDKPQSRHRDNRNRIREKAPSWDAEESLKAPLLPDTKDELRRILEAVDPEELMMTPLFQKRKYTNPTPDSTEEAFLPDDLLLAGGPRVEVDVVTDCPICDKPMREIMYALHDYDHNKLAHFDCVFKKVSDSVQDKLIDKRHLAYLGSGAFGIMEPIPNKPNRERLIEKIYPGAPVEELLHAGENQPDEEL